MKIKHRFLSNYYMKKKNTLFILFIKNMVSKQKKAKNISLKQDTPPQYGKLFDIAANLSDEKFSGLYGSKQYHENDLDEVLLRAKSYGVQKMLFAGGIIEDSHISYKLASKSDDYYITIGTHPCRAKVRLYYKVN